MQLVTWNTQWCCGLDGVVSPQRIVEHARALADFDVLCLQEIAVHYPALAGNAGHDQVALLRDLLPGYQVFFGAAVDEWTPDGQRQRFGNLIATRLPVLQLQHHPLPYPADAGVPSMPRMCTVATVRDPALGAVRVMTTHLEFYSKRQRMAQARALRALHGQACAQVAAPPQARSDGSPFQSKAHTAHAVLCGDFNFEAHEPEHAAICAPSRCRRQRRGPAWRPPLGQLAPAAWQRAAAAHFSAVRPHLWARAGGLRLRFCQRFAQGPGAALWGGCGNAGG